MGFSWAMLVYQRVYATDPTFFGNQKQPSSLEAYFDMIGFRPGDARLLAAPRRRLLRSLGFGSPRVHSDLTGLCLVGVEGT